MWHSVLDFFGIINESGKGYGFWSGVGSDLGEVALIGAIYAAYRRHNCHVKRCWRLQRHAVEGTPWVVCRKHHPTINDAPSADDVAGAAGRAASSSRTPSASSPPAVVAPRPAAT